MKQHELIQEAYSVSELGEFIYSLVQNDPYAANLPWNSMVLEECRQCGDKYEDEVPCNFSDDCPSGLNDPLSLIIEWLMREV